MIFSIVRVSAKSTTNHMVVKKRQAFGTDYLASHARSTLGGCGAVVLRQNSIISSEPEHRCNDGLVG